MNILYYGLSANQGGIETYLYKVARNINKEVFHIAYIDETGGQACFREELEALGAKFYDITPRRESIFQNHRDLNRLFSENKIDVLHFNCNSLSYVTPILVAQKHGTKIVLHSRNSKANLFSSIMHRINFVRINSMDEKKIKRIAVSDVAGQWMFGKKRKYEVINNGVDINKFQFDANIRDKQRLLLGMEDKHIYGNVGAFLEAKNHAFLLRIFRRVLEIDNNAVLLLVGDGPLRDKIEQLAVELRIAENVVFMGIRNDIPELLMAMDCLIFPSLYEGFPNVILEAETTGLPIVMSEKITDEVMILETCKKLRLDMPDEKWAKMCVQLMRSDILRNEAAGLIEKAGFSVDKEIKRIENIYRKETYQ